MSPWNGLSTGSDFLRKRNQLAFDTKERANWQWNARNEQDLAAAIDVTEKDTLYEIVQDRKRLANNTLTHLYYSIILRKKLVFR